MTKKVKAGLYVLSAVTAIVLGYNTLKGKNSKCVNLIYAVTSSAIENLF